MDIHVRIWISISEYGPRPPDRAIGPAGHSSYTVPGRGFGPAGSDSLKHWHVRAVPIRKTSSWAAPAAVAPSRYRAAATGQGHRPAGHSSYTVRGHGPWRDRTQSPKHWRVRAVPVRKTSSWAPPAAQAVAPYQAATGQGHRAGGPLYSPLSRSLAAS